MDYSDERQQHIEDTKYLSWADGMYVMLDDLECDYEKVLVEGSLRGSSYFKNIAPLEGRENCMGVYGGDADYWLNVSDDLFTKLTRAQALYIATGDVSI